MKILWGVGGVVALGLGAIGAVVPLLPTVPFVLLAAYCFSQSSDRLHDWLLDHDIFGPTIRDWRAEGAISRRGKLAATLSILLVLGISFGVGLPLWLLAVQCVVLSAVLLFIWTRPTGSPKAPDIEHQAGRESDIE